MCRSRSEGSKRCSCDNPTKRRQRRAIQRLRGSVSHYTSSEELSFNKSHVSTFLTGKLNDVNDIKTAIDNIRSHSDSMSNQEVQSLVCEIGSGIERLALTRHHAPHDDDFKKLSTDYETDVEIAQQTQSSFAELQNLLNKAKNKDTDIDAGIFDLNAGIIEKMSINEELKIELLEAVEKSQALKTRFLSSNPVSYQARYNELLAQRSTAYKKVLQELGVTFSTDESISLHPASDENATRLLKNLASYFPANWWNKGDKQLLPLVATSDSTVRPHYIDSSSKPEKYSEYSSKPMPVQEGWKMVMKKEPFYNGDEWSEKIVRKWKRDSTLHAGELSRIYVNADTETSNHIALHELSHRCEKQVPSLLKAQAGFKARRAQGQSLEAINNDDNELGYRDNFIDHYMGKEYEHDSHEIFSTGMEGLFFGSYAGFTYQHGTDTQPDPDYRSFILGCLTLES